MKQQERMLTLVCKKYTFVALEPWSVTPKSKPPCFLQIQLCGTLLQKNFQQGVYDSSPLNLLFKL
jgi:hypothetical protein